MTGRVVSYILGTALFAKGSDRQNFLNNAVPVFRSHWLFLLLLVGLTAFQLWGINKVPFHPDEATQLYMSGDLELLFTRPLTMGYDPARDDRRQELRELDAPLTKYVLGLGRWAFGFSALPVDWDWGKTWEENEAAGALPSPEVLFAGRLAVTLLLPLSLLFAYLIGLRLGGRWAGVTAVLLLGLNALTLLHTRRAMAEGALVFGVLFAVWSFIQADKYPRLAGLGMALAFNAKQSALTLLPVGVLAVVWVGASIRENNRTQISRMNADEQAKSAGGGVNLDMMQQGGMNLVQYLTVFGLVTFLLNPLYWRNPLEAAQASVAARQDLLSRQVADAERLAPGQVLDTPTERLAVILGHLYVLPLQFFEVGNYRVQTADAEQVYLAIPGHEFLRGLVGGGILLALTLVGMVRGILDVWRKGIDQSRAMILLLAATGVMAAALIVAVPLPFQRYSMPLLPLVILWMGVGVMKRNR